MSEEDQSQKTEEPTDRKLQEAFNRGQVPFSKEVTTFLLFTIFTIIITWIIPANVERLLISFKPFLAAGDQIRVDGDNILSLAKDVLVELLVFTLVPALMLIGVIILSAFLQNGIVFSVEPIMPKLEKISILKGIKRIFSMRAMLEFIKGIVKMVIVGAAAVIAVWPYLAIIKVIHAYPFVEILGILLSLAIRMLIAVAVAMGVIGLLDLLYQRFDFRKNLRMSKKEIKDELRQSDGNPEVKAKLRQIRIERASKRMMAQVPDADVIITNPEHFSVALEYKPERHHAPVVLAKGQDHIAFKIREIAKEHHIPLVQNPLLARGLFASTEIGDEIPVEHYKAVAEVISYVFGLKQQAN